MARHMAGEGPADIAVKALAGLLSVPEEARAQLPGFENMAQQAERDLEHTKEEQRPARPLSSRWRTKCARCAPSATAGKRPRW